ncbi:P-loop containing nucleoside triphosphate hydrolase protein [Jimgerdemannia flammicorona]|uniref:P-loop containing nucleoside triphosphate hydrolase protein n=1 Tax=Jimgerdemannia flammicorona TaxID=994334 RepID=A0A433QI65_9FUNG|nr:P-loop containing nucleoside triphosphate hydrolase protein [Jimgerdemannia flammicorona]
MAAFEREITADNGDTVNTGNQWEIRDPHNTTVTLEPVYNQLRDRPPSPLQIFDVLEARNDQFVGRDDIFEKLHHLLDDNRNNGSLGRVALVGLGRMGKTQIALEYCFRNYQSKYQYVFWIMANSEESWLSSIKDNESTVERIALVKQRFQKATKRWLLVFDNTDDESVYRLIHGSYPSIGDGDIILTTCDAVAHFKISNGYRECTENFAPKNNSTSKFIIDPDAQQIIEELGHLPLAIDLAGACMERDGLTPGEFLMNFKDNQKEYLNVEELTKATGNTYHILFGLFAT